jgi:hypothetical protein
MSRCRESRRRSFGHRQNLVSLLQRQVWEGDGEKASGLGSELGDVFLRVCLFSRIVDRQIAALGAGIEYVFQLMYDD